MNKLKTLVACLALCVWQVNSLWAIDSFAETFNGTGPFESDLGGISGLDNPGWYFSGDGEIKNGGYAFFNAPEQFNGRDGDEVTRYLSTNCSYTERIELSDVKMIGASLVRFDHASTSIVERSSVTMAFGRGGIRLEITSQPVVLESFPVGTHVAMELRHDGLLSQITFGFDNDYRDEVPPLRYGPFPYMNDSKDQLTNFIAFADFGGEMSGVLDNWTLNYDCEASIGDFNSNGTLDVEDIDLLSNVVRQGTNDSAYDLTADQLVDESDRNFWVTSLKKTYFGDSNLDGEFGSADLVVVFQSNQYEDLIDGNSTWATGDWNGDAEFNSRDLVFAFTSDGYEKGPRAAVVPEPGLSCVAMMSILGTVFLSRGGAARRAC